MLLVPDYAGWEGGDEGWWAEMVSNGPEKLEQYGRYVGNRYRGFDNIMWVEGGDFNPTEKGLVDAVARGIQETDPGALHTAHLAPDTPPRDFWSTSDWLDVDNVYTYGSVHDASIEAYQASTLPYLLIESNYENEHDVTQLELRSQAYDAVLAGATGYIFGNNPIWHFGSSGLFDAPGTWQEALTGPGSQSVAALASILATIDWWQLRPDSTATFLTDGAGHGSGRAVGALAADRTWGAVYAPEHRTIRLDLARARRDRSTLHLVRRDDG